MDGLRPPGLEHRAPRVPPLRGFDELARPLAVLLPVLGLLALSGGLLLRGLGGNLSPAALMATLGAACWLLGLPLAMPLHHMLLRLDRHRRVPVRQLATRISVLLVLVLSACALSLAMLPVHFAFDQAQELFTLQTLTVRALVFRSSYFMLLLHLLAAPAYILISTGLLRLLRSWLPPHLAALLWLTAGLLTTTVAHTMGLLSTLPLSLGIYSEWLLVFMDTNKKLASPYLQELVEPVLLNLLMAWGAGLLLAFASLLPPVRPWRRIRPLWLATTAGLLAAGLQMLALTLRWTREVLPLSPADWWSVLLLGTSVTWAVWLISCLVEDGRRVTHSFRRDIAWLLLLPAGLLGLTIPCIAAGDAERMSMLNGLLLLLPVMLAGICLPLQLARAGGYLPRLAGGFLLAGLLLLPLPLRSPALALLDGMRAGFSLDGSGTEQLRVWACLLVLAALSWPGLLHAVLSGKPRLAGRPAGQADRGVQ